jgi:uncharacterized protein YecE (DUF72 family)
MNPLIYVGTSGWQYYHWRGVFYPESLNSKDFFKYYINYFITTEINATFYRDVREKTFENWYKIAPEGFKFSVKLNRTITHFKHLKVDSTTIKKFLDKISLLKEKLGIILIQLPPGLKYEPIIISEFLNSLDKNYRYAMEIRNKSFINDNFFEILSRYNIAFCIAHSAERYPYYEIITANFIYLRLHGYKKLYSGKYPKEVLKSYAEKIKQWRRETYIYFDNDFEGNAVVNALELKKMLL